MLVKAASEIQQAKGNCLEAGNTSVCGVTGSGSSGVKSKKPCISCNTMSHNEQGLTTGARRKHCKASNVKCGKCKQKGHFTEILRQDSGGRKGMTRKQE